MEHTVTLEFQKVHNLIEITAVALTRTAHAEL
jgi:hypothetical protein